VRWGSEYRGVLGLPVAKTFRERKERTMKKPTRVQTTSILGSGGFPIMPVKKVGAPKKPAKGKGPKAKGK
jgi:hypothetical protein